MNREDILFAADVSTRYHRRRASACEAADKLTNWLTVIVSSGAFISLGGGEKGLFAQIATAIVALLSLTQIVFGFGRAACDHEKWYKDWCELLLLVRTTPNPRPAVLNQWIAERSRIEREYPHEKEALAVDCRNDAIVALDLDETELRVIRWWQKPFLQVFSLQRSFPKVASKAAPLA